MVKHASLNRVPRYDKIRKKLGFALSQHRALQGELLKRSAEALGSQYIEESLEVILSAVRECLDYCARDISEQLLSRPVKEPKFPFSRRALDTQRLGRALAGDCPALHAHLARLVAAVEDDANVPGTLFSMGTLQRLNDLVNDKKHNITVTIDDRPDTATLISHGEKRMLVRGPVAVSEPHAGYGSASKAPDMVAAHGAPGIRKVSEAYITSVGLEVASFCLSALGVTWRVLDEIYSTFFGRPGGELDPWESTKPPEQRSYEAAVKRLSPIRHRLSAVALRSGQQASLVIRFDQAERPETSDAGEQELAADLVRAFHGHLIGAFRRELEPTLRESLAAIEAEGARPRYAELAVQTGDKLLVLGDRKLHYNNALFGVVTTFRDSATAPSHPVATDLLLNRLLGIRSEHVAVRSAEPLRRSDRPPPKGTAR